MIVTVKPLRDRILLLVDKPVTEVNGVAVPESGQILMFATVVAVGCGRTLASGFIEEPLAKPGNRVIFEPSAGTPVTLEGVEYRMLHERLIMAVIA